ncbi:hypothetical protein M409DRAFT_22493 [Zasmidium cellare ATCC 36951]|uniref:Large ribosomal subunit protein mL50 n=1 Tax=Zasmidium cellare ATCC 36951 TaxID=1080233 RepID=A0A6A6CIG4_ZASCE|nr:uncharacterized protein M409DRAFT_22493 [Zasmidium cellare ATCC 36951]KAF2167057.1 hypothetical protein M409DRAFT_22493 [Zasmidium cellare ATCC 36951]
MRNVRAASQALRLAGDPSRQQYVCRACLAQASRHFSTSPKSPADEPWWKRMRESVFGSEKSKKAEQSREDKRKKKLEDVSQRKKGELEQKVGARGKEYVIADVVDTYTHKDYVSSQTWDGLEKIGSEEWVRKRADMGEQYQGFLTRKQSQLTNSQWQRLLHQITVEVLALKNAGRDVLDVCKARKEGESPKIANVTVEVNEGVPTLKFEKDADQQAVLSAIEDVGSEPVNEQNLQQELRNATMSTAELPENIRWMAFGLEDSNMKLAILKRAMQLTGKRIPDPALSNVRTLTDLYNALMIKEKPKKLTQDPKLEPLKAMGNVQVHATRRTPVHKDKEVGRWKIIEDELKLRNLPVFGTNYAGAKLNVVR